MIKPNVERTDANWRAIGLFDHDGAGAWRIHKSPWQLEPDLVRYGCAVQQWAQEARAPVVESTSENEHFW